MMPDGDDLRARVAELEARVVVLEAGAGPAAAATPVDRSVAFWALEGLRSRTGPSGGVLFTGAVGLPTDERVDWQQGLDTEALLDADWNLTTDTLAALGHPVRLLLLREILRGVRSVTELGNSEGLGTSGQLYHHLRQLVSAGWLRTAGRGRYEVPVARIVPLLVIVTAAQR